MEKLVDVSKLMTVRNYAAFKSVTTVTVYGWIKTGKIESVIIDGVLFIINENGCQTK